MIKFLMFGTYLGGIAGSLTLLFGLGSAKSAPQEASIAAIAVACAVIPYVIARTAQIWHDRERQADQLDRLIELQEANQNRVRELADRVRG